MNKIFSIACIASMASVLALSSFAAETAQPSAATPGASASSPELQGRHDKASRRERMQELRKLTRELGLSQDQQDVLRGLFHERRESIKNLSENERKGEKGDLMRQEFRQKIRSVLTPEQQAKFDAMKKGPGEHRRGRD